VGSGWFFCGEVVVNCVVDVDGGMGVFGGLKIGHMLQLFFSRRCDGEGLTPIFGMTPVGDRQRQGGIQGSFPIRLRSGSG
jgi:hypothetical protein